MEAYKRAYAPIIYPIPSEDQWVCTTFEPMDPPFARVQLGSTRKLRKKGADELRKSSIILRWQNGLNCSKCKEIGHNKRTCPRLNCRSSSCRTPNMDRASKHCSMADIQPPRQVRTLGPPEGSFVRIIWILLFIYTTTFSDCILLSHTVRRQNEIESQTPSQSIAEQCSVPVRIVHKPCFIWLSIFVLTRGVYAAYEIPTSIAAPTKTLFNWR